MKLPFFSISFRTSGVLLAAIFALAGIPAFATTITFTNNSAIGAANSNFDGNDIVVTNCTLTVDGSHTFSSMHVAAGGVLTHSFAPGGSVSNLYYVTNEAQVLYGTNPVTLLYSNVITASVVVTDLTGTNFYTNNLDYLLTSPDGIVTQLRRTTNSTIPSGGIVLVSYEGFGALPGTVPAGLYLSILGNVQVDTNGAINASGIGYSNGPGAGTGSGIGGGGAYGGNGGSSSNAAGGVPYGYFLQPTNLGSGGGPGAGGAGGVGGGLIQIAAGGSLIVNGLITANGGNGTNSTSGGGAGGSIWISGLSLTGAGAITANGGAGDPTYGGGGGGGRISFQYSSTTFTGSMSAFGGVGGSDGTAGTVYTQLNGQNGLLVLDNGGRLSSTNTILSITDSAVNVLIQGNASVQPSNAWTIGSLTVASNGLLVAAPLSPLNLTLSGPLTVEVGGGIIADGKGYAANNGSGYGHYYSESPYFPCGGGGYGGYGANGAISNAASGGGTYGTQSYPSGYGSGGGGIDEFSIGGSGGGSIQITSLVSIVQVDGIISANGINGSGVGGGGGSGGTILLIGGTLLGSGSITASGGTGANGYGGGGGGGRVFINPAANLFSGNIAAYGGGGANWGGAGTVVIQVSGQNTQLILDNGGNAGTNTLVTGASATDLIVRGGAIGSAAGIVSFTDLYVNSNGWLAPAMVQDSIEPVNFTFSGNATIQPGGGIVANVAGSAPGQGSGAGRTDTIGSTNFCGGAGHGGVGGSSFGNYALGGSTYDSPTEPAIAGSGGGSFTPLSPGGYGGGVIRLSVTGTLEVDGIISANGGNGSGLAGGGGSGGSIWLSAGAFSGAGAITANGGTGANALGGGGGGGMTYVSCNNNSYVGTITAYGGSGANWGGPGTTVTLVSGQNSQLIVDAGGNPGAPTPLPSSSSINVTLRNGALGYINGPLSLGNVLVSSNAFLQVSNTGGYSLTFSSLTVQAGGEITADSQGYPGGSGTDPGRVYTGSPYDPCGGGGNGGFGGNSVSNLAMGGGVSGYKLEAGSGGGTYSPYSLGGSGGGEISITTTGLLQVDGIISANGGNGGGLGGGGGSGGSIALTCGSLGGAGVIRANGGNGADSVGGGGGGGIISVTVTSTVNQFSGSVTAYGGGGANWGGAGPVSTQTGGQAIQLIYDNGGNSGPVTPLQTSSSSINLTLRNGAAAYANGPWSFGNVLVSSNASMMVSNLVSFTCSSLTVQAGGLITADSQGYGYGGYSGGQSSGSGPYYPCGGGGNGGVGGNSISNLALGGNVAEYESSVNPGSSGGTFSPYSLGGSGGGVATITVTGLAQVDGIISAGGGNGAGIGGGGGSGGYIALTCGSMAGAGVIRANGGSGAGLFGGGGGGGFVTVTINNSTVNGFSGTLSAYGGGGANWGGAGPVSTQTSGQNVQIIYDNGGNAGPATPFFISSTPNLTLRNGAVGLFGGAESLSLGNVLISSNATLQISNLSAYSLTCSNLTVQPGGEITADSQGSLPGSGSNPGHNSAVSPDYPCGGGGNGGAGGNSISNLASGGNAGEYQLSPGSGGGNYSPYSPGGSGGGLITITTTGLLQVDGIISANGGNGGGGGGGGGAGGTIALTTGSLGGAGTIRANGGTGANLTGGGGGGGWISITVTSTVNQFAGTLSAYGGGGASWGGAGQVSTQTGGQGIQLIVDGGGNPGAYTPINSSSTTSVTLRNGAMGFVGSSLSLANILISSNAWLLVSNSPGNSTTMTFSSATVQAGGGIIADSQGYPAGNGSGAGHIYSEQTANYPCSGAGHGGLGGNSYLNAAAGGSPYDNEESPSISGSGGGTASQYSFGGAGGGALSITVTGLLQVDGVISANGGNGSGIGGGGGSGGSIRLTTGTLSGGGAIRANGGSGANSIGGGGAGGCIAIFPTANLFTGVISTYGGGGANSGGAGSIYTQMSGQAPQLVLDNGGQSGAATPIQSILSTTAIILRNGAVGYQQNSSQTFASLLINSNGWLAANTNSGLVNLTLTGNATVEAGGGIVTDNAGSIAGSGSGAGHSYSEIPTYPCSGAGYGGFGGNSTNNLAGGGPVYASITSPTINGSGGGSFSPYSIGGPGGGSIHFTVDGTLDASGRISANGGNGSGAGGGGGSGGSILLSVGTLTGDGAITANGGNGADAVGGGGGGGRISISFNADSFTGITTVHGGGGYAYGGAGTIYTKTNSQSVGQVLVENGGETGADTPLSSNLGPPSAPFNLTIENGGVVCPQTNLTFPLLENLTVASGGLLTGLSNLSTLDVLVFDDADVSPGGAIAVNGEGYSQATGPGAGQSSGGSGSGAGYGGRGGASSAAPGGIAYGSALQPVDFGSGGGFGSQTPVGGSGGGGAIRLNVGGILTLAGEISAEGEPGLQDNSGGGSGGSVWVSTGALVGSGLFAADGGEGELYGGGGGAGGRIAVYILTNAFLGSTSASGATGDFSGANGTILISNNVPLLQVLSNSLSGMVSNGLSSLVVYFSGAPNPNTVSASTISLTTPGGPLSPSSVSMLTSASYLVSFPQQTANGIYALTVGPGIYDLYGRPLAQSYTGTFTISLPVIQGNVTDGNGNPLAGVLLQPSPAFSTATTDTNGNYSLGFVPGSSFTVTPSLGNLVFAPPSLSYTNASASVTNQNYIGVATLAPMLSAAVSATNFALNWHALPGINYQVYCSTDLVNWLPYGGSFTASNGPVQVLVPLSGGPQQFFSVQPGN